MLSHRVLRTSLVLGLACGTSACLERCAPGQVGTGVARLTVRNLGAVVQLVNDDTGCGFESPSVLAAVEVDGDPGGAGCATWRVAGCRLEPGTIGQITYDCRQDATIVTGAVEVDATRRVCGTLTGDLDQPVVPLSPDAATIALSRARFWDFRVEDTSSDAVLTWLDGEISAVASPRLAASAGEGICMVPTPNIQVSKIAYRNARVHVVGEGRSFEVAVESSELSAVNGVAGLNLEENVLEGSITVWGRTVDVAPDDGLDPDYDPARFVEAFTCEDDLALPVSYTCTGVGPALAQGASRLTVRSFASIVSLLEDDPTCGFSSAAVQASGTVVEGAIGGEGRIRFAVDGCTIEVPPETVQKTSCLGVDTVVGGRITVSAEKTMVGRLTGDLDEPVVPMTDHPVEIVVHRAEADGFSVAEAGTALTLLDGALAGRLTPRTALDTELDACGFVTPIARFEELRYLEPTDVIVEADQGRFETRVEDASLYAVNGAWQGEENVLSGSIAIYGETHQLPATSGDGGLDPDYDPASFEAGWMCGTVDREDPFSCRFAEPLAQGASQLTAMMFGRIANLAEDDTTCGFSSDAVRLNPTITGALGDPGGQATFSIATPCRIAFAEPTVIAEDCLGKRTYAVGAVEVTGTKTLLGYVSGDPEEPIVPTSRDPAEITLETRLDGFAVWTDPGDNAIEGISGRLSGTVRPRTALDTSLGACSIPTPVAQFDKMSYSNARLGIESDGKRFTIDVASSSLTATNGRRDDVENHLAGRITVDGETFDIPTEPGEGLDPDYDPADFVARYACEPNLQIPTGDEACDMLETLAEGTARLLIAALGAATSVVNDDGGCGYDALGVKMDPDRVVGDDGEQGLMEWELDACEPEYDTPYAEDCLGTESYMSGRVSHTGRRTVEGLREEITVLFFTFDSIAPSSHNSVTIVHDALTFDGFEIYELEQNASIIRRGIQIHSGTMSASVEPITGRNDDDGAYDVPTKVARMSNVRLGIAPVTIMFEGKQFNVAIDHAELYAFNGSWVGAGETNRIDGEISVEGRRVVLNDAELDPDYDQAEFDAAYACTDNLDAVITPDF